MIGVLHHPYGEPNTSLDDSPRYTRNNCTKKPKKVKDYTKAKRVQKAKEGAPGVPHNSCPYIDLAICNVQDLGEAYDKLRTKGTHTALIPETEERTSTTSRRVPVNLP